MTMRQSLTGIIEPVELARLEANQTGLEPRNDKRKRVFSVRKVSTPRQLALKRNPPKNVTV